MVGKGIFALSAVLLALALQAEPACANEYPDKQEYNDKYPEKKYPEYPAKKEKEYEPAYKPAEKYEPYPEKKVEYPSYPEQKQYTKPEKQYEPAYKPAKVYEPYQEKKEEYPSYPEQKQYPKPGKYEPDYNSYKPQDKYPQTYDKYPQTYDKYPQSYDKYSQPGYQPNYQQYYESESAESEEYGENYKYEDTYKCRTCERPKLKNKVVVIAVAGLRSDAYAKNKNILPTLTKLIYEGTVAKYMNPVFPSEVVPTSRAVETGVWSNRHDLVGNYHCNVDRFDNHTLSEYRVDERDRTMSYPQDYTKPHIGILQDAKVSGLKVCSQGFLRNDVHPYGITLDYAVPWPGDNDNDVNTAQDNMAIGAKLVKDCDFTVIYVNELLNRAIKYGPNSKQVRKFLRKLDNLLNKFLKDLECEGLNYKDVNLAIVGLNGVSDTNYIYKVYVDKYLPFEHIYRIHSYESHMGFFVYPNRVNIVYNRLKYIKGIDVYLRKDIPAKYYYKESCNCPDILIVAQKNYYIMPVNNPKAIPSIDPYRFYLPKGFTGRYAGDFEEARTSLVLVGPAFKKYHTINAVEQVDLYNLWAYLLRVYPRKNDGKLSRIQDALVKYVPYNYNDDKYP